MTRYILYWFILIIFVGMALFGTVSLISNTSFVNILSEFELLLTLLGFSSVIATIIVSAKVIIDKINQ